MINITLPDGSVRQYDKGITSMQIAHVDLRRFSTKRISSRS